MKTATLTAVGLLSWAAGLWHLQVFVAAASAADGMTAILSNNVAFLAYTAMLFLAPVAGWLLRRRAPFWVALLVAAFPLLMMAMTIRIRVV